MHTFYMSDIPGNYQPVSLHPAGINRIFPRIPDGQFSEYPYAESDGHSIPTHREKGFSLIELLVTVAVLGIVVSIALPSYQEYMVRARRSAAQSFLLEVANKQQQYLMDARTYTTSLTDLNLTVPNPEVSPYYTIAIAAGDTAAIATSFKITATAQASQAGDGNLTLDNLGVKTPADKWK